ncbi:MAG: hypothetical protein OHK006_17260 [Thermodesulfovibrionales bacterium]
MDWYYIAERKRLGPVNETEFGDLIRQGKITDSTPVWNEGIGRWQPYMNVKKQAALSSGRSAAEQAPAGPADSVAAEPHAVEAAGPVTEELHLDAPEPEAAPETVQAEPAGERAYCAECGRNFGIDDLIRYENLLICADCKPRFFQKIKEGSALPFSTEYAGFWIRFAAKIIDGVIMGIVNAGISFLGMIPTFIDPQGLGLVGFAFSYLLQLAAQAAYATFFVGRFGATPGKMVCNIKIVTAEGEPVSYARALGRHFAEMLSAIILMIGYIMAAFDEEKRALHDRICNTRVIKK